MTARVAFGSTALRARGFTLLELVITVVIVAVLAAIALPSYREYILRANRADAKAILMETSQFMERYFTSSNTYVASPVLTPVSVVSPKDATGLNIKYVVSFTAAPTAAAYTVQAVPANGQVGDVCGTLSLTNTGVQSPSTAGCW